MRVHRFPAFVVPEHCTCPAFPEGVDGADEGVDETFLGGVWGKETLLGFGLVGVAFAFGFEPDGLELDGLEGVVSETGLWGR